MKKVQLHSTLECLGGKIISRKITPSAYIEYPNIGRCVSYKCSRNSQAEIIKELDPKKAIINPGSLIELGDQLECISLLVAIKIKRPIKKIDLLNQSGRHKAQTFKTNEFTYAKITEMHSNIPSMGN